MKKIIKTLLCLVIIITIIFLNSCSILYSTVYATNEITPIDTYSLNRILESENVRKNNKIAFWTNDEKTKADIIISYKQEINDGLYLATLCNAHKLNLDYLSNEITAAASMSDISLYLEGRDIFGATFLDGSPAYQKESKEINGETINSINRVTEQKAYTKINKGTNFNVNQANLINIAEGPTKGKYVRFGTSMDVSLDGDDSLLITSSGEHANVRAFADDIINALSDGTYNPEFIIISFDAWVWACQAQSLEKEDDAEAMLKAAKLLEKYYKEKRVIWLTAAEMITDGKIKNANDIGNLSGESPSRASWTKYLYPDDLADFKAKSVGTDLFESDEFKNDEKYANYRNSDGTYNNKKYIPVNYYLEYITSHHQQTSSEWVRGTLRNRTGNEEDIVRGLAETKDYFLMSKKAPFYQWAILNPEKYITVVDDKGIPTSIPDLSEWNTDVLTIAYDNAELVAQSIHDHLTGYNTYSVSDTLAEGLIYNKEEEAEAYYLNEENNKWEKITSGVTVEQDANNKQLINVKITNEQAINKRISVVIHTMCSENEFCEFNGEPKNTNEGIAKVTTYYNDVERITTNYISPKLKKVCPKLSIEKTVLQSNAKAGDIVDYTIKVSNKGHGEATNTTVIDKLPDELIYQSSTPEGTIEQNIITWKNQKVPAVTYENGKIAKEGSLTITVKAKLKEDVGEKTFTNTVYAYDPSDPEHPNEQKAVSGTADVTSIKEEVKEEMKEETKEDAQNKEEKAIENPKTETKESKDDTKAQTVLPKTGQGILIFIISGIVISLAIYNGFMYRRNKDI